MVLTDCHGDTFHSSYTTTAHCQGIVVVSCHSVDAFLLTEQVSAVALMDLLSLSRTQLILG